MKKVALVALGVVCLGAAALYLTYAPGHQVKKLTPLKAQAAYFEKLAAFSPVSNTTLKCGEFQIEYSLDERRTGRGSIRLARINGDLSVEMFPSGWVNFNLSNAKGITYSVNAPEPEGSDYGVYWLGRSDLEDAMKACKEQYQ
jgi:hypothetical protein